MNKRGKKKDFSRYNLFPRNRKGNHVEVVISFIIFITFVIFLFASVKPSITKQEDKKNIYENIELKLLEKVSSDVTSITISVPAGGVNCIALNPFLTDLNVGRNLIVKDNSGAIIPASISSNSLQITRTDVNDYLFKAYYSEEFPELEDGTSCGDVAYQIGMTKTNKYVFEVNIRDLIDGNYNSLKEELKIPDNINFGYGIILSNGTPIIETAKKDVSTNIYVTDTPIEYVNMQEEILSGYFRIKIW